MTRGDKGSVRWHQNRWEIRVQVAGERVTKRVKAPNTRAGRRIAEQQLEALVQSSAVGDWGMTVSQMLDRYEVLKGAGWAPSTRVSFPLHTAPIRAAIGEFEVQRLRTADLEGLYAAWRVKGLAASTVRRRHAVLAAALRQAERWEVISVSPARNVELDRDEVQATADLPGLVPALRAVLALNHPPDTKGCVPVRGRCPHRRLAVAAWLAIVTGARRGELVGLRWRDIDLDAGVVRVGGAMSVGGDGPVRKSTKGGRAKVVGIDEGTVAVLREWRAVVAAEALEAGVGIGAVSPVLPSPGAPSTPWHPKQVTLAWHRHRDGVGMAGVRFHDLRNLHATHLLGEGVPVSTVSARLGHSSKRMTYDVYDHAMPAGDLAAVAVIGAATQEAQRR